MYDVHTSHSVSTPHTRTVSRHKHKKMKMDENLYRSIRNVYSKFVYEILEWDSRGKKNMIESGKILEFWNGKSLIFEDEEEMNVSSNIRF